MKDTITTIYCLCDDLLKALEHHDDPQTKLSSAEVMTVPLVAARFFGGKIEWARRFLLEHGYFTQPLSQSRLNRRLHALPLDLWHTLFALLGEVFKQHNHSHDYVIDSLPIAACDNIRIKRCQLLPGEEHRGYIASKRRYFYGLKVHLVITGSGWPVEFVLTPGSTGDVQALKLLDLDLPSGATLHGDRAYTDYKEEDLLHEAGTIRLQPQRKKNAKRGLPLWLEFLGKPIRQRVETSFSQVTALFPKSINAVTGQGFVLKITCFLLAFAFQCLDR
jgi:hypothetical protein